MLLHRGNSHLPTANRVAALAVGSELPPMQIGVTFRAGRGRSREYQAGVTTLACDSLVQALQRETRLPVMIELRLFSDGFPCGTGVTVFATNVERPVRVSDTAAGGLLRGRRSAKKCQTKHTHQQTAPRPFRH